MKPSRIISNLFAMLALLFITLALIVTVLGIQSKPILLKKPEDAAARVRLLLESVKRDDYATVSECLLGNPSMGADRRPDSDAGGLLWDTFTRTFAYTINSEIYTTDQGLAQDVTVSYLDLDAAMSGLNEQTKSLLQQRIDQAQHLEDIYDENLELREELVMEALHQALSEALEGTQPRITQDLTLNLVQRDHQWWVAADSALLSAISGSTL